MSVTVTNMQGQSFEAVQYTGDNLREVMEFTGKHPSFDDHFDTWEEYQSFVTKDGNRFKLISDVQDFPDQYAVPGDWILRTDRENRVVEEDLFSLFFVVNKD